MKTTMKTSFLPMATIFFTIALAGPVAADQHIPFSGSLCGQETDVPHGSPPAVLLADGSVKGVATRLGVFTLTYKVTVKLADGSGTGAGQLIAANGDSISATTVGQGNPVPDTPGLNRIVEIYTITSGTGRFMGAKGSFTVVRLVDLPGGSTAGSVHGIITVP